VTGWSTGAEVSDIVYAGRQLAYVVLVPLLVVNVVETPEQARQALGFGAALAVAKAVLGLAGVVAGVGTVVDGATITYYEPVANWLSLLVIVGVVAALLLRARLPLWLLAGTPLIVLTLALSLRRSFWIGAALALLLVCLLGSRPLHRRLLVPRRRARRRRGVGAVGRRLPGVPGAGAAGRACPLAAAVQGPGQRRGPLPDRRAGQRRRRDPAPPRRRPRLGVDWRPPTHCRSSTRTAAATRTSWRCGGG
jgi:hypothetical protein